MRAQTFITTETQAQSFDDGAGWATLFIAAPALRGDHTTPHLVHSLAQHDAIFGGRAAYSELRDQLETFFAEGGKRAHVARVIDESANTKATVNVLDGSAGVVAVVTANSVGAWGDDLDMVLTAVSGVGAAAIATWTLNDTAGQLEQIVGKTATEAAAHEWRDVDVTLGASSVVPVAATYALASGADGNAGIATADYTAALARFGAELGTGLVVTPMLDATAALTILQAHGAAFNRRWLVHSTDTPTAATIQAQGVAARAAAQVDGGIISAKVKIPGLAVSPTTKRTISPVGAVAGLIARSDEQGTPVRAAAGIVNGRLRYAVEATQTFSDADLDALHDAGINVIRSVRGILCLYDFITPAPQSGAGSEWLNLGHVRAHAAILAELDLIAEFYQFALLAGTATLSDFHASITSMLMAYHDGLTLYGASASEAFSVNVLGVNNDATIAANELHAAVGVKYSETNYWTHINVTKVPFVGIV